MTTGTTQLCEKRSSAPIHGRPLKFLGNALLTLSWLGLLGVIIAFRTVPLNSGETWLTLGAGATAVFLIAFIGVKCRKRGKQMGVESAQALLAEDNRPPVVYLRSFQDDYVTAEGTLSTPELGAFGGALVGGMLEALDLAGGTVTEEEQLAEALKDVGPFVAIGKPGEKLPQLGASRMYLQDSEWRQGAWSDVTRKPGCITCGEN